MIVENTEQDKLLALFRAGSSSDAEEFNSTDLLTQSLVQQLGRPSQAKISEVEQEIVAKGEELDYAPITSFSSNKRNNEVPSNPQPQENEVLIGVLRKMHASLVDVFERSGLNSGIESSLVTLIDSAGSCLTFLGESTHKFEPLKHLSGLQAPNMLKNASKVLETTLNCYKLGEITESKISDDGSVIEIVFSGKSNDTEYKAFGEIQASSWEGSEAIDYIYTPGSGKMSVKSFEGGKWVDKSDHYHVTWALEEHNPHEGKEVFASVNEFDDGVEEEINEKKLEDKKEVPIPPLNNDLDDEEIGDFPIND
jgi:hypothetical protein